MKKIIFIMSIVVSSFLLLFSYKEWNNALKIDSDIKSLIVRQDTLDGDIKTYNSLLDKVQVELKESEQLHADKKDKQAKYLLDLYSDVHLIGARMEIAQDQISAKITGKNLLLKIDELHKLRSYGKVMQCMFTGILYSRTPSGDESIVFYCSDVNQHINSSGGKKDA